MRYRFAPGVFACRADGHLVVLNVPADRYLLLPPALDAAIMRLVVGEPDQPGDALVRERLSTRGLILERTTTTGKPKLCDYIRPEESQLAAGQPAPPALEVAAAAGATAGAIIALRHLGLERALRRVAHSVPTRTHDPGRVATTVAGFAALRLAIRALDRCLPLSLALARKAKRHHPGVRLVMGVKCNPFGAHAWVQLEACVLNDRLDAVRPFTPILVL